MLIENMSYRGPLTDCDDITTGLIVAVTREEALGIIAFLAMQLRQDSAAQTGGFTGENPPYMAGLYSIGTLVKDDKRSVCVNIKQAPAAPPRVYFTVHEPHD